MRRTLPAGARPVGTRPTAPVRTAEGRAPVAGWIDACASAELAGEDVLRFDHAQHTYAIYRDDEGRVHATDGMCTHGHTHLADGHVAGRVVECPKHNGRFDVATGEARRLPACIALRTHRVKEEAGRILLDVSRRSEGGCAARTHTLEVVANENVATFIKELVLTPLAPDDEASPLTYLPGQYLQVHVPRTASSDSALSMSPSRTPRRGVPTTSSTWSHTAISR